MCKSSATSLFTHIYNMRLERIELKFKHYYLRLLENQMSDLIRIHEHSLKIS